MRRWLLAATWLLIGGLVPARAADYAITWTDLTPAGAYGGSLTFTSGSQQAGDFDGHAAIWLGPSHTLVNLHPASAAYSEVLAGADNRQGGDTYKDGYVHAAMWSGTRSSYRDLHPSWASHSQVLAMTATQQGGYAQTLNFEQHAGIWSGTASSFVDLHPAGAGYSIVNAMAGNQQAGHFLFNGMSTHAALWSGTAASLRDLNPAGATASDIRAMTDLQQVGVAGLGGAAHAGIWFGTAESFVDIHPVGAVSSTALATIDVAQAGHVIWDSYRHAVLWFGSADRYIDLHEALGPAYRESEARSIWTDGSKIVVAGHATDYPGDTHPMLWELTIVPEPEPTLLMGFACLVLALVRSVRCTTIRTTASRGHRRLAGKH